MRIATLIISLILSLAVFFQSCAATIGGSLGEEFGEGKPEITEAQDPRRTWLAPKQRTVALQEGAAERPVGRGNAIEVQYARGRGGNLRSHHLRGTRQWEPS